MSSGTLNNGQFGDPTIFFIYDTPFRPLSICFPIMADSHSLPLSEKTSVKVSTLQKALEIVISSLFICLLVYRLLSLTDHGFPWLLAFLCESWFAFNWVLNLITEWTPMDYKTYPDNLLQQYVTLRPSSSFFFNSADIYCAYVRNDFRV